jgi:hypothetical protein
MSIALDVDGNPYGMFPSGDNKSQFCFEARWWAQTNSIADGQSKAWVNSYVGLMVAGGVAEIIYSAAARSGAELDKGNLGAYLGLDLASEIDDQYMPDPIFEGIVKAAVLRAKFQTEEMTGNIGFRVRSAPVDGMAYRAGTISLKLLEAVGERVDPSELFLTLTGSED